MAMTLNPNLMGEVETRIVLRAFHDEMEKIGIRLPKVLKGLHIGPKIRYKNPKARMRDMLTRGIESSPALQKLYPTPEIRKAKIQAAVKNMNLRGRLRWS